MIEGEGENDRRREQKQTKQQWNMLLHEGSSLVDVEGESEHVHILVLLHAAAHCPPEFDCLRLRKAIVWLLFIHERRRLANQH